MPTRQKIIVLIAFVGFAAGVFAQASEKTVEDLMRVMKMEEQYAKSINIVLDMHTKAMGPNCNPAMIKVIKEFYEESAAWKDLKPSIMKAYADTFSEKEIKELTAFYNTPLGQKVLEKQPELQQRIMQLTVAHVQKSAPKLQQKIMEAMQQQKSPQKNKIDQRFE